MKDRKELLEALRKFPTQGNVRDFLDEFEVDVAKIQEIEFSIMDGILHNRTLTSTVAGILEKNPTFSLEQSFAIAFAVGKVIVAALEANKTVSSDLSDLFSKVIDKVSAN